MGDRERDKGKQKISEYEGYGDSSQVSARRTRARLTSGPGGQNGAGINPSLAPLDPRDDRSRNWQQPQERPAEQGGDRICRPRRRSIRDIYASGGEEGGGGVGMQDPVVTGSFLAASSAAQHQETGSVGNPGTSMPPLCAGTPSSTSQMNFARDSTQHRSYTTEVQPAATMDPAREPGLEGQAQPSTGAGQQHFPQVPEHQRCPGCRDRPGVIAMYPMYPQRHVCVCDFCRVWKVVCPVCRFAPPVRQPLRKGES